MLKPSSFLLKFTVISLLFVVLFCDESPFFVSDKAVFCTAFLALSFELSFFNETSLKNETKNITKLIKEPLKLKKDELIQISLSKMKNEKAKFAIVINENDVVEGIVTIGDIVEELIGKQVEN